AVGADEGSEVSRVVGDDLDGGTIVLDVDVDVTVEVGDVEQLLEVISRDLALLLEAGGVGRRRGDRGLFGRGGLGRRHGGAPHGRVRSGAALLLLLLLGRGLRGPGRRRAARRTGAARRGVLDGRVLDRRIVAVGGRRRGCRARGALLPVLALRLLTLPAGLLDDRRRVFDDALCGALARLALLELALGLGAGGGHAADRVELL